MAKQAKSWASSAATRAVMQGNKGRDTKPELAVRRLAHAQGLRYRVDYPPLEGLRRRADLVFTRARVAVFVDGCFWHGCPEHQTRSRTNADYWEQKIAANVERDLDTNDRLRAAGWVPARYWAHEDPAEVVRDIERLVASSPSPPPP